MSYAQNTNVSIEKTQMEIQQELRKIGVSRFGLDYNNPILLFQYKEFPIRIKIPYKSRSEFQYTEQGKERSDSQIDIFYERSKKQAWRQLLLLIKAKIIAIESGITYFEKEFLSSIITLDGKTIEDHIIPQLGNLNNIIPQLDNGD